VPWIFRQPHDIFRGDSDVCFKMRGVSVWCSRNAFDALPDSMPGRLLRSADFSADRSTFDLGNDCSSATFESVLDCAETGRTVKRPRYCEVSIFLRELAFLGVDIAPDRSLPASLRAELVAAADLLCGQLEKIDVGDILLGATPCIPLLMPAFSAVHARDAKAALALLPTFEAEVRAAPGFADEQTLSGHMERLRRYNDLFSSPAFYPIFWQTLMYTAQRLLPTATRLAGLPPGHISEVVHSLDAFVAAARLACHSMRATQLLASVPYVELRVSEAFDKIGIVAFQETCNFSFNTKSHIRVDNLVALTPFIGSSRGLAGTPWFMDPVLSERYFIFPLHRSEKHAELGNTLDLSATVLYLTTADAERTDDWDCPGMTAYF
jgi:hypothetical protein